ncbi:hypothetical protein MIR68_002211 [Amoeboaphelidium protococcarum]|nr:hypothetical protein MIR68_002211 [Amoeboaphelidium protococcarum]
MGKKTRQITQAKIKLLNKPLKGQVAAHYSDEDEDLELNKEDLEFFQSSQVDMDSLEMQSDGDDKEEFNFENGHKAKSFDSKLLNRDQGLMIKTPAGKWIANDRRLNDAKQVDQEDLVGTDKTCDNNNAQVVDRQTISTDISSGKKVASFADKKIEIGSTAALILQNNEEYIGKLKVIRAHLKDDDKRVVKLAMLSLCAIFADIVPSYRVRELTEKERAEKVSKEVRKVRDYEEAVVSNYKQYVDQLDQLASRNTFSGKENSAKSSSQDYSILYTAVKCLCQLAVSLSHFNHSSRVISGVVKRMNLYFNDKERAAIHGFTVDAVSSLCCDCAKKIIMNDTDGRTSLEIVKLIADLVKVKGAKIRPCVLEPLLLLELTTDLKQNEKNGGKNNKRKMGAQDKKAHLSKKQKKQLKVQKEVELELKEADAVVSAEERGKYQAEILKHLFSIYVRVLKFNNNSHLLQVTLKGLSKFARLINVEFFQELVIFLRKIIANDDELSPLDVMLCVQTSMKLLCSFQAVIVNVEYNDFKVAAYRALRLAIPYMQESQNSYECELEITQAVEEMMSNMFLGRRTSELSANSMAAFIKRIAILTTALTWHQSQLSMISLIHRMLLKSPQKVLNMIQEEEDDASVFHQYNAETDDVDKCFALESKLYELSVLSKNPNALIRKAVHNIGQLTQNGIN